MCVSFWDTTIEEIMKCNIAVLPVGQYAFISNQYILMLWFCKLWWFPCISCWDMAINKNVKNTLFTVIYWAVSPKFNQVLFMSNFNRIWNLTKFHPQVLDIVITEIVKNIACSTMLRHQFMSCYRIWKLIKFYP